MRAARLFCVSVLTAVFISTLPVAAAYAADTPHFQIVFEDGSALDAVRVERMSLGSVRFRAASGEIGYLNGSKIRAIYDDNGRDRRSVVIVEGRALGEPLPEEQPSMGRWLLTPVRAVPDRARRSYFLAEYGVAGSVAAEGATESSALYGAFGGMKSLGRNWAMGGVVEFNGGSDTYHMAAIGIRARRYLSNFASLQGTAGLFSADYNRGTSANNFPAYADAGVTLVGAITVFGRMEHHRVRYSSYSWSSPLPNTRTETDNELRIGVRFGPRPLFPTLPLAVLTSLYAMSVHSQSTAVPRPLAGY